MLMLGVPQQQKHWPEAGITLNLIPLPSDVDQQFVRETLTEVRDDKGNLIDIKRDIPGYAQRVGRYCIKGWAGVVNAEREPLPCTPEAIDQFMLIEPAQNYVFAQVKGLSLYVVHEVDAAKNA